MAGTAEKENEQTEDIEDEAEEADLQAEKDNDNAPEKEKILDDNEVEEDIELWKEELSKDTEKKDYIVIMEDEKVADEIQEEYREVTKEDVEEAKEVSAGDVQVVVSEMTGETAAEILGEDGVLCVEEEKEIAGLTDNATDIEEQENVFAEGDGMLPNDTWNLEMVNADVSDTEPSGEEAHDEDAVRIAVLDSGIEAMSDVNAAGSVNLVDEEGTVPVYMEDMTGHGTSVAQIIQKIAPDADIYSVKVLDENNRTPISRIIRGIYWCIENDVSYSPISLNLFP